MAEVNMTSRLLVLLRAGTFPSLLARLVLWPPLCVEFNPHFVRKNDATYLNCEAGLPEKDAIKHHLFTWNVRHDYLILSQRDVAVDSVAGRKRNKLFGCIGPNEKENGSETQEKIPLQSDQTSLHLHEACTVSRPLLRPYNSIS
ncbi:hypothetical protein FN846DRAFT_1014273 [Sphaerosporella brunnea]|uniref:Uncharacterized protein n=1 Tax=Sphaerosporella brunnea TaxID=1250544 RepID=A0A5J5EW44_9PEZI|nr:hypothetical protein FN846DRAFT_1014273 [Sphaerosporella brunnea]